MKIHISMPNFKIEKTVIARFISSFPDQVKKVLKRAGLLIVAQAKAGKLSGQILRVRTGRLRASVTAELMKSERAPRGTIDSVAVGSNVWYGAYWEEHGRSWLRSSFDDKRVEVFNILRGSVHDTIRGL